MWQVFITIRGCLQFKRNCKIYTFNNLLSCVTPPTSRDINFNHFSLFWTLYLDLQPLCVMTVFPGTLRNDENDPRAFKQIVETPTFQLRENCLLIVIIEAIISGWDKRYSGRNTPSSSILPLINISTRLSIGAKNSVTKPFGISRLIELWINRTVPLIVLYFYFPLPFSSLQLVGHFRQRFERSQRASELFLFSFFLFHSAPGNFILARRNSLGMHALASVNRGRIRG